MEGAAGGAGAVGVGAGAGGMGLGAAATGAGAGAGATGAGAGESGTGAGAGGIGAGAAAGGAGGGGAAGGIGSGVAGGGGTPPASGGVGVSAMPTLPGLRARVGLRAVSEHGESRRLGGSRDVETLAHRTSPDEGLSGVQRSTLRPWPRRQRRHCEWRPSH